MRIPTLLLCLAALPCAAPAQAPQAAATANLMPVPRSVTWGGGRLTIDSSFSAATSGRGDARVAAALGRALVRLRGRTAVTLAAAPVPDTAGVTLVVTADAPGQAVQGPDEDESYVLDVTSGRVILHAATSVGALRGLETFLQLVTADSTGFFLPAVHIEDAPRFPWRGLLVDAGRHFMPPDVIRRTLDGMAAVKLNVLHWHLSEDQGFRVESRRYPRLQGMGSDGQYYTQDEIRSLVAYARARGIRVVPEFDMPGHSASWFVGYPMYAAGPGPFAIVREFGVFDPVFDPTREEVYRFLDGFIGEMSALFPDPYWHIGGDEVNGVQWNANAAIQRFKTEHGLADNEALQAWFNQRLVRILEKHHKRMMGWDEILHPDLPSSAVIQSWRGAQYLEQAARQGYAGILSAGFYLDHQNLAETHYLVDPLPAGTTLTPEQQALVLGGEACMWAEHVTPETEDSRIWPRLIAVAERLWSPREVRDVPDMYRRLWITSARLEELGLQQESHSARMARRILPPDGGPLVELLRWVQPVTFGQRGQLQHPNQLTPLVSLVDAARPDPPGRAWLLALVDRMRGGDSSAARMLTSVFAAWRPLADQVARAGEASPRAADGDAAAAALRAAGMLGLEALDSLATGRPAGTDWTTARLSALQGLERPQSLLRLAVTDAVRGLIQLAGAGRTAVGGR